MRIIIIVIIMRIIIIVIIMRIIIIVIIMRIIVIVVVNKSLNCILIHNFLNFLKRLCLLNIFPNWLVCLKESRVQEQTSNQKEVLGIKLLRINCL